MTLSPLLFGLFTTLLGGACAECYAYITYCVQPTAMNGIASVYLISTNVLISIVVIVLYTLTLRMAMRLGNLVFFDIHLLIFAGFGFPANSAAEHNKQRVLQSLFLVMSVYVCTWVFTVITILMTSLIGVTGTPREYILQYTGLGVAITISCNPYIYALRSIEYRNAFKKLYQRWSIKPVRVFQKLENRTLVKILQFVFKHIFNWSDCFGFIMCVNALYPTSSVAPPVVEFKKNVSSVKQKHVTIHPNTKLWFIPVFSDVPFKFKSKKCFLTVYFVGIEAV